MRRRLKSRTSKKRVTFVSRIFVAPDRSSHLSELVRVSLQLQASAFIQPSVNEPAEGPKMGITKRNVLRMKTKMGKKMAKT